MKELPKRFSPTKGDAYIVIEDTDLANLIKACRANGLEVGKDVGIVAYNETPLKEILLDGITVISTSHECMGMQAARMIMAKRNETIKNPFAFIRRSSL